MAATGVSGVMSLSPVFSPLMHRDNPASGDFLMIWGGTSLGHPPLTINPESRLITGFTPGPLMRPTPAPGPVNHRWEMDNGGGRASPF